MTDKPASETPRTDAAYAECVRQGGKYEPFHGPLIEEAERMERALHAAERKLDIAESERVKYVEKYEYACQRERAAEQAFYDTAKQALALADRVDAAEERADAAERELAQLKSDGAFAKAIVDIKLVEARDKAEQERDRERAARERVKDALRAWKAAEDYQATYRHLSQAQEDIADAWQQATSLRDQALAQEGGKP